MNGKTAEQLRALALDQLRQAAELDERARELDCGYTNHETFTVAMQLAGNMTPGGAEYRARVEQMAELRLEAPAIDLADALREHVETLVPESNDLAGSLRSSALGRVDWLQLARELRGELEARATRERERGEDVTGRGY
jgi:hypothetical protein